MPYGVYTPGTAGDEVSSTYEGRHLTFSESQITHPSHTDGLVDKGDPVLVGESIVGVAFISAIANTDLIPIDTEGIWQLSVVAENDGGNDAVAVGDPLYINTTTAIISKIASAATQRPFGYALYPISSGETDVIPVKVHWDPLDNWVLDDEPIYFGDGKDGYFVFDGTDFLLSFDGGATTITIQDADTQGKIKADATIDAGAMDDGYGILEVNLNATGVWTGHGAAASAWANLAADCTIAAGNYICARNDGVYEAAGGTITNAKVIIGARMHALLGDADGLVFPWSINTNNTAITALIDCNNFTDLGLVTDAGSDAGTLIPIARDASGTLKYVKIYDHS